MFDSIFKAIDSRSRDRGRQTDKIIRAHLLGRFNWILLCSFLFFLISFLFRYQEHLQLISALPTVSPFPPVFRYSMIRSGQYTWASIHVVIKQIRREKSITERYVILNSLSRLNNLRVRFSIHQRRQLEFHHETVVTHAESLIFLMSR